jgi:outer membrane biosynthesis protein TonB
MADLHDPNALDQLFKKSFESLSEAPDANGWDTPSPRVWQNIQTEIAPQSVLYSKYLWSGLGLAAIALLSFVFFGQKTEKITAPVTAPSIETPVIAAPVLPASNASTETNNTTKSEVKVTPKASNQPKPIKTPKQKPTPTVKETKSLPPNSSERAKQQAAQGSN